MRQTGYRGRLGAITGFGLLLAAGGCALMGARAGSDTITADYAVGGGEWNTGGGITAVAAAYGDGGQVVICGAWTTDRQSALSILYNDRVMEAGIVTLGDRTVAQNLGFMTFYEEAESLLGRSANCVSTGLAWQDAFAGEPVGFRFPRLSYPEGGGVAGAGGGVGTGDSVTFRQTTRPNPLL